MRRVPRGDRVRYVRHQSAVLVEQFFRPVTPEPVFEQFEMPGVRARMQRHLVRAKRAFDLLAIHDFRPGPALGRFEHDHGPARPCRVLLLARLALNGADLLDARVERLRHGFVHRARLMAADEVRRPSVTAQQLLELLARDAG